MKTCAVCNKGSVMEGTRSFLRSHYNPTSRIRKYPNLQWARLEDGKRTKVCARCIKGLHKD